MVIKKPLVQYGGKLDELHLGDILYGSNDSLHIDQSGGTGDTYGVLLGFINGINTQFTVSAGVYTSGTLTVYLNGQLQTQGTAEDWIETDPTTGTFNFITPPISTDKISVFYTEESGGGATKFTDLTDVPSSYTGQSGKMVSVKSTEDGLEFVTASTGSVGMESVLMLMGG